jgi:hypothetical protein
LASVPWLMSSPASTASGIFLPNLCIRIIIYLCGSKVHTTDFYSSKGWLIYLSLCAHKKMAEIMTGEDTLNHGEDTLNHDDIHT